MDPPDWLFEGVYIDAYTELRNMWHDTAKRSRTKFLQLHELLIMIDRRRIR